MNWKTSLDRYLTTPPDDGFDNWYDKTIDKGMTEIFYRANEDWLMEYDGQFNKWMNKLFRKGYRPHEAASIIQRAHRIYLSQKP